MIDRDFRGTIRSYFRRDPCIIVQLPGLGGATGGLIDVSGNAYHATARNSPASYHGRFGGHAYRLVNTDGVAPKYIDVPGSTTVTWAAGTKLSLLFWIYITALISETNEPNFRFIEKGADSSGGSSGNFNLAWGGAGLSFAYTNAAQTVSYAVSQSDSLFAKSWNCVGLTYTFPSASDPTKPRLYVNGVERITSAWNSTPNGTVRTSTSQALTLGADQYAATYYATDCRGLNGILDEIAFWKGRIVSPVEMAGYYRMAMRRARSMRRLTDAAATAGSSVAAFSATYARRRVA